MKALIQRVKNASVSVNDELVSSIGQGLCVLIGISSNDTRKDMEYLVRKLLSLKIFNDEEDNKRWKRNVVDCDYELLCVSQFTLYNTLKGNKPDFHLAMAGEQSKEFYEEFIQMLRDKYKPEKVKDGVFGAYMQVTLQNDGPVTLEIESPVIKEKVAKNSNKGSTKDDYVGLNADTTR
ncbi:D-aminoacyl-tRNA deacylase [Leptidea sinapis]|uniref:D-aminoacyl-tRNA deacylase n=1 Tax=Leptidea sinapis TaxID=189913 RepID=A0A5E4QA61_9NEOP|nr:D-aminoacyl-tRNA deacylase [Leptidea sinapis]VVC95135.1 unnamed protein product [Leptidea sinapis]